MVSIAEARNQLTAIIHRVEAGQPTTISRRGKPVAVLLSMADYERLLNAQSPEPDGWNRLLAIRQELAEADAFADWSDEVVRQWRDRSPGRPVAVE
jgi:prevent-host-death family protein